MNFLALLSPTSILAGIVIALSLSNALFFKLWSNAKDDLITYKAEVSLVQEQIEADVQRKLRDSAAVTANLKADLDTALAAVRRRPVVRVQSDCNTRGLSPLSSNAGINAQLPTGELGLGATRTIAAEECETRINRSLADAVWIEFAKVWAEQQHEASK